MQAVEDLLKEAGSLIFWHLLEILNILDPEWHTCQPRLYT